MQNLLGKPEIFRLRTGVRGEQNGSFRVWQQCAAPNFDPKSAVFALFFPVSDGVFPVSNGVFRRQVAIFRGRSDYIEGQKWSLRGAKVITSDRKSLKNNQRCLTFSLGRREFFFVQNHRFQGCQIAKRGFSGHFREIRHWQMPHQSARGGFQCPFFALPCRRAAEIFRRWGFLRGRMTQN